MIKEKMVIYTMNNCGYCKLVKEELEKNNIEFEVKLVNEHQEEWDKIINLTSMPTTPTIYYKENYFIPSRDFSNPQQLITILNSFKKSEFSEARQVLEKVKTLNSNINIAFGRLDQLLRKIETNTKKE